MKAFSEDTSWRGDLVRAVLLYLATRLALFVFVWLTGQHFGVLRGLDRAFFPDNHVLNGLFQWDAFQYLQLIDRGYYQGAGYDLTVPFFPGFPVAAWSVGRLVGSTMLGGIVLNHLCSIGGAFLITRLSRALHVGEGDTPSESIARETTLFWLASPLSFFFCVFLSESLFGFASVLALWAVVTARWPLVFLAGVIATSTRNAGMIVFAAAAVLAWERRKEVPVTWRGWTAIALMPLGLVALIIHQKQKLGDGFAWVKTQQLWNRYLTWPWTTLRDDWMGTPGFGHDRNLQGAYHWQELIALFAIAPLFFYRRKLNLPWGLLLLGVGQWMLPLISHSFLSAQRYQAGNVYFALAIPAFLIARPQIRGLIWMLLGMVLAWYASTFPYGMWVT